MKSFAKLLLGMILSVLFLTGCGCKAKQEVMTCTKTTTNEGASMSFTAKIYYTGEYVDTIETTDMIETEDTTFLDGFKSTFEESCLPYKEVEYYSCNMKEESNKITGMIKIEYNKINTDKLIEVNSSYSDLIHDGKVKLEDIKDIYLNSYGTTCTK